MAWLTNWNYRKAITISNAGSTLSDYQVLTTIDTATLISAGKMQLDCDDIRFTSSDGSTLLNYWIESGCNTASIKVWVKVDSIPASASKTIYMYYGNGIVASASNGTNTFDFFDDFSGDLSKWDVTQSTAGNVQITNNQIRIKKNGLWTTNGAMSKTSFIKPFILEGTVGVATASSVIDNLFGLSSGLISPVTGGLGFFFTDNSGLHRYRDGSYALHLDTFTHNVDYRLKLVIKDTGYTLYKDGVQLENDTTWSQSTNTKIELNVAEADYFIYYDNVLVRKYASPEPTTLLGSEETPANITAMSMTITPSETPCRVGICTVTVEVTWINNGGTSSDFIPNITIDGTQYSSPYPLQSLGAGLPVTKTFTVSGLAIGTRSICPYPN